MSSFSKFIICLFINSVFCFGQSNQTDSLRLLLPTLTSEKEEALILIRLSQSFSWNNADSMLFYAGQSLTLARKNNIDSIQFLALRQLAYAQYVTGAWSQGIRDGMEAYDLAKKNKNDQWIAAISNTLGLLYQNAGRFKESIPFLEIAVATARRENDLPSLATGLNNLSNSYMRLDDLPKSKTLRKEAILIRKKLGNQSGLADCYNDIAETFLKENLADSALSFLHIALQIKDSLGDKEMIALITLNTGNAYMQKSNFTEAFRFYKQSEKNALEIKAYAYLDEIYFQLAMCSKLSKKPDEAFGYLLLHEQYKDSVLNVENQRQLNELNEKFQSEKKTSEIENLKKEKNKNAQIAEEKEKRKNMILLFSFLFILAVGAYTFLLFKRYRLTKSQKATIELQKIIVEEKQKEILDSIHYAERIQKSLLPTEKYIQKNIDRLKKK